CRPHNGRGDWAWLSKLKMGMIGEPDRSSLSRLYGSSRSSMRLILNGSLHLGILESEISEGNSLARPEQSSRFEVSKFKRSIWYYLLNERTTSQTLSCY